MSRLLSPGALRAYAIILLVLVVSIGSRMLFPVPLPHIQLPGEIIPGTPISNTFVAVLVADATLLLFAVLATRKMELVPRGAQNVAEAVIGYMHHLSEEMIGSRLTRQAFPLVATIFLLVLAVNWWELVPGVDSIGVLHEVHQSEGSGPEGYRVDFKLGGALGLLKPEKVEEHGYTLVPFLRVGSSDLSFTLALALIAFVTIEYIGLRELGMSYVGKFINFSGFRRGIGEGLLGVFVGVLELVSEVSRIISYSFRLFGNLFAGQVLLFVMAFLVPLLLPLPFFALEMFVGLIQAFVFAILTLAFIAVAIVHEEHA